jgi:hypothetical protein
MRPKTRGKRRTSSKRTRDDCPTGKTRYRDHESAVTALRGMARSTRERVPGRAYPCDECAGWHLTATQVWGNGR